MILKNNHFLFDSDHDMVDVSDDNVVRRLNSFLVSFAYSLNYPFGETIEVVRRRFVIPPNIGLSFDFVEIVEDNGNISLSTNTIWWKIRKRY